MDSLFVIKYGEISLKGRNRPQFEAALIANTKNKFPDTPMRVTHRNGRIYLFCRKADEQKIERGLGEIFGIVAFAPARACEKDMEAVRRTAAELAEEALTGRDRLSFKIDARRTDKSFPLSSYQIACDTADHLLARFPKLVVDVHTPEWPLAIEIREKAYLYGNLSRGLGGLPVGCNGRGLLLLSGGIDSPVAGFLMAKRGLSVDAVYFHTHPFTSPETRQKVIDIARVLGRFIPGLRLLIVNFTEIQVTIKEKGLEKAVTLLARASMMRITEKIAEESKAAVLITGECLGQVASQTPESLTFTGSFTRLPVLRPLIGMDKTEIIEKARTIGTYDISTRPYDDCCTLFAPEHPIIRPDTARLSVDYHALELDSLIEKAAKTREEVSF